MSINTVTIMANYINGRMENSGRAMADDGLTGKAFEVGTRSYIMGRLAKAVKAQGKTDIRFTNNGKRFTCEIKSACGEIETAVNNQYIIYAPIVNISQPAESQGYVMTRKQWADFVNGYNGRGKFTRIDSRGHEHIQSFYGSETVRPKASKAIARYIWEYMATLPTVEEFFDR